MSGLKKSISVVFYDNHEILGDRTINSYGSVCPILPMEVRKRESLIREEYAKRIAPRLQEALIDRGVKMTEIKLTGSVASGFAGPTSDIDFEVGVDGLDFSELTPEYFEEDRKLTSIAYRETTKIQSGETGTKYRINVHLSNGYRNREFLERIQSFHREGPLFQGEKRL